MENRENNITDNKHQQMSLREGTPRESPVDSEVDSSTQLLDLNDDCLFEVVSMINTPDLCSVARTSFRLKEIADRIFRKRYFFFAAEYWLMKKNKKRLDQGKRILVTFGSLITLLLDIDMNFDLYARNSESSINELAIRCCSGSLKKLHIGSRYIPKHMSVRFIPLFSKLQKLCCFDCTFEYGGKELFANCKSLLQLVVTVFKEEDTSFICENTFPKLKRFNCNSRVRLNLGKFLTRHKKLESIEIRSHNYASLIPIIADNCKKLKNFEFEYPTDAANYEREFNSLVGLKHLSKLNIHCNRQNINQLTKYLSSLKSLEFLDLVQVQIDSALIMALSKVKKLQVLKLSYCEDVDNLNFLGTLDQLTELVIRSIGKAQTNLDVVVLIKCLINLKSLEIDIENVKINEEMHIKIVEVVRSRPTRSQQILKIKFRTADVVHSLQYHDIVTLHKID